MENRLRMRPVGLVWKKESGALRTRVTTRLWTEVAAWAKEDERHNDVRDNTTSSTINRTMSIGSELT